MGNAKAKIFSLVDDSSPVESSPMLAVFVGVVSGFLFILTVLVAATRSRCRHRRRRHNLEAATPSEATKLGTTEGEAFL